jgi:hypothetical protein
MPNDDKWQQAYRALLDAQSTLNDDGRRIAAFEAKYGRDYIDAVDVLSARIAALESVLRELVGVDDLPPGWVSMSVNTEPLDICGYCGALAEYHQEERHWHADHTDDCPVARARRLLDGAG